MLEALREFTLVHAMSAARRQVAADLWTKPIGLNHKPTCRLPVNYTHHGHFIITQPKADTHFTITRTLFLHEKSETSDWNELKPAKVHGSNI